MSLPLPRVVADVEAGGPYVTAARGLNKLSREEMETQFYPEKARAETASKNAYSKFVGPQMIAQILGGAAAGNLSPEQYGQYVQQMAQMLQPDQQNNTQAAPRSNSLAGGALDYLMSIIIPKKTQQTQPFAQPSLGSQPQTSSSNPFSSKGSGIMMPPHPEQNKLMDQWEGKGNTQPQSTVPGYTPNVTSNAPSSRPKTMNELRLAQKAEAKVRERNEINESKVYHKEWQDKTKELGQASKGAHEFRELIKSFNANYPKLKFVEKGQGFGRLPAISDAAQKIEKVTALAEQAIASANQHGARFTNADLLSAQRGVPSRILNSGSAKSISNQLEAMSQRNEQAVSFYQRAKKMGLTTGEADKAWLEYIDKYPLFNHDTDELIPRKGNEYINFLSPGKAAQLRSVESSQADPSSESNSRVLVRNKKTGATGYIPADRLEAYEANNYEKV